MIRRGGSQFEGAILRRPSSKRTGRRLGSGIRPTRFLKPFDMKLTRTCGLDRFRSPRGNTPRESVSTRGSYWSTLDYD